MRLLDILTKLFRRKEKQEPKTPKSYGTISVFEEIDILKALFKCQVNVTDEYLQLTTVEEARRFVVESAIQYRKWIKNKYDCDNFSASLYGYWNESLESFAFGMARSATHQFNIMIDKDKKVWIIEPQTAKFYSVDELKRNRDYLPITLIWL